MLLPEAEDSEAPAAQSKRAIDVVTRVLDELSGHSPVWWEFRSILGVIGRSMDFDRVYVFENGFDRKTGTLIASQKAEWCADGVDSAFEKSGTRGFSYEKLGERWLEELSSGRAMQAQARKFTDMEHAVLGPQDVKSILMVPLMVGGVWWGVIGFDQCSHERTWDPDAIMMLTIAGSLIAGQIDRQRLRMNLEAAEKRSRFAMQVTGVGVWDFEPEAGDMFIAAELKDTLGFANEEFSNNIASWLSHVPREDAVRFEFDVDSIVSGAATSFETEHRMITKRGETRWFLSRGSAVRDAKGKAVRIIGTSTDVTERKRTETAFRAIFEGSPEGMLLLDIGGHAGRWTIVDCNDRAASMHGFEREEMLGRPYEEFLLDRPDAAATAELLAKTRDSGALGGEAVHIRKGGSNFWCGFQRTILNIDGEERLLVVGQDITERRRHEEERLRASKLEALGLLAGGIAHDFNNVLTAITANLSLVRMDLPKDAPVGESLDAIEKASGRARSLAAQLLTFARGGMPVMRIVSLADTVNSAAHLSSRGSRCKVQVDIAPDAPPVEADEGQISQVLQNLIINADQAMPDGGVIVVSVDRVCDEDFFTRDRGGHLRIRVTDKGHGIPEEILTRIFDPYFSTKPQGSGLGLATTYSIVRHHGGSISVKSEVGKGTEFTILLPTARLEPESEARATTESKDGNRRLLVMDDEHVIRLVAQRGLSRFGYEVVLAKDGEEAIAAYQQAMREGKPFAAIVLDMVIPGGIGGEKTLERIREIDPDVRALAMSGYSTSGVMGNPAAFGFKAGLPKPFSLEQFAAAIAGVVNS
ncbi:MAG TPA: ATP-binding protein [Opitutaceae bacterium]|nr:ATP-binding protein [Opitutaceae bacterium]